MTNEKIAKVLKFQTKADLDKASTPEYIGAAAGTLAGTPLAYMTGKGIGDLIVGPDSRSSRYVGGMLSAIDKVQNPIGKAINRAAPGLVKAVKRSPKVSGALGFVGAMSTLAAIAAPSILAMRAGGELGGRFGSNFNKKAEKVFTKHARIMNAVKSLTGKVKSTKLVGKAVSKTPKNAIKESPKLQQMIMESLIARGAL